MTQGRHKLAWRTGGGRKYGRVISRLFDAPEEAADWLRENPPEDSEGRYITRVYPDGALGSVDAHEYVGSMHGVPLSYIGLPPVSDLELVR